MKAIIIATDFSDTALNAARYGTDLAVELRTDVLLLHVYQLPVSTEGIPVVTEEDIRINAALNMEKLKKVLQQNIGDKIRIETKLLMGSFFRELNIVCKQVYPYAVILGAQGKTAMERLIAGSRGLYTLKHLSWPVISVPPGAVFSEIKKVGLACDFNHATEHIKIDEIERLLRIFDSELHVLNIAAKADFNAEVIFEAKMLYSMLKKFRPVFHFLSDAEIDDSIIEFADKNDLDLLIILPKRHSLLDKMFHRSHTRQFVLHSHVPVMALHL